MKKGGYIAIIIVLALLSILLFGLLIQRNQTGQTLKNDLDKTVKQLEEANQELGTLKDQIGRMEEEADAQTKMIASMNEERNVLVKKNDDVTKELKKSLEQQAEKCKAVKTEAEALSGRNKALAEKLTLLVKKYEELAGKAAGLVKKNKELAEKAAESSKKLAALQTAPKPDCPPCPENDCLPAPTCQDGEKPCVCQPCPECAAAPQRPACPKCLDNEQECVCDPCPECPASAPCPECPACATSEERIAVTLGPNVTEEEARAKIEKAIREYEGRIKNLQDKQKTDSAALKDLQGKLAAAKGQKESVEKEYRDRIDAMKKEMEGDEKSLSALKSLLTQVQTQLQETEERYRSLKSTHESLVADLNSQIETKEVEIKQYKEYLKVSLVDRILFKSGRSNITQEGRKVLALVADTLKNVENKRIRVVGHTDNQKISKSYRRIFPSNWELSAARAAAVTRFFQQHTEINPEALEAVGRSYFEPITANDTQEGRAKNRRVEIIISPEIK